MTEFQFNALHEIEVHAFDLEMALEDKDTKAYEIRQLKHDLAMCVLNNMPYIRNMIEEEQERRESVERNGADNKASSETDAPMG